MIGGCFVQPLPGWLDVTGPSGSHNCQAFRESLKKSELGTPHWGVRASEDLFLAAACMLSYFVLARGGNPLPEQYVHEDGGRYRGQWRGAKKHGLGVYTYPGGGCYEGRWADNLKEGLGVYTYPKVGLRTWQRPVVAKAIGDLLAESCPHPASPA